RKENKFLTYRNVFMLVMSILNSFCIFFSYTLPFVFGFGAFIIYKKELNNLPLIIMTVLTAFTLNISSAFRLIIAFCFMLVVNQNYIVKENKSTYSVICALITLLSG